MYIKKIRKEKGVTLDELAKKIGTTKGNISLIENNKLGVSLEKAERIAEALNCDITDLIGTSNSKKQEQDTKTIQLRLYDLCASAGSGCWMNDEEKFTYINIDKNFLNFIGCPTQNHKDIYVIKVSGFSMFPTLGNGDLIFVNVAKKEIFNNKIYVINENNLLKVKRILINSPFDQEVTIQSDNTTNGEYPPYKIKIDEVENIICGQVIFYCRSL